MEAVNEKYMQDYKKHYEEYYEYIKNYEVCPQKDYYKMLGVSRNATHNEIYEAIMTVMVECGYDEDNPMIEYWKSDRAPLKWKQTREAKILLDPIKRAEYDAKLDLYISSKQKVTNYVKKSEDSLSVQKDKVKIEKTKTKIADAYKTAIRNIIIVVLIACAVLIPGIRNGILRLIGNPIITGLNIFWLGCLLFPICFLGYKLFNFIFEPIIYAHQQRKKLKESNRYKE